MAAVVMVIHEKEADPPCPAEEMVWVSAPWLCAALPTLQGAGRVMTLGAAWGIRGAGGITGPLHGQTGQEHSWTCSALGKLVYKNFGTD